MKTQNILSKIPAGTHSRRKVTNYTRMGANNSGPPR